MSFAQNNEKAQQKQDAAKARREKLEKQKEENRKVLLRCLFF